MVSRTISPGESNWAESLLRLVVHPMNSALRMLRGFQVWAQPGLQSKFKVSWVHSKSLIQNKPQQKQTHFSPRYPYPKSPTQWPTHSRTPELQINHLHENSRPGVGLGITILHFRHPSELWCQTSSDHIGGILSFFFNTSFSRIGFNGDSLLKWRELPKHRLEELWGIINRDNENSCWSPFHRQQPWCWMIFSY